MHFTDKVVILTGASGGIGKQIAFGFAREGAKLAICARTESKLNAVAQECRSLGAEEILAIPCDVSDVDQLGSFVDQVAKAFGGHVDVLVNNAVSSETMVPLKNQTLEGFDKAMKSGLYASWNLMKLVYPLMHERGGSIINFGSSASDGKPGLSSYGIAKAAICALTRAAAVEWGPENIRVNNVLPYALTENMVNLPEALRKGIEDGMVNSTALKRLATPEKDIVPVVLFLASDDAAWITGQDIHAEGGVSIHD